VHTGGIGGYLAGSIVSDSVATGDLRVRANGCNSTAAGIAGFLFGNEALGPSSVSACRARGDISLGCSGIVPNQLMFYAGGIFAYAGNGRAGSGSGGVVCGRNRYEGGEIYCGGVGFPYAGGIAGAMYFNASSDGSAAESGDIPNSPEDCAALNGAVKGFDSSDGGAAYSVCRIAGNGDQGDMIRDNNYAWRDMPLENRSGSSADETHDCYDGAGCALPSRSRLGSVPNGARRPSRSRLTKLCRYYIKKHKMFLLIETSNLAKNHGVLLDRCSHQKPAGEDYETRNR
jgi:hypothetical protein